MDAAVEHAGADAEAGNRPGARGRVRDRLTGLLLVVLALGVLGVATRLTPAGEGGAAVGTHTALGLSPCGFLAATGLPCATCGMTTATALASRGRLVAAAVVQPAGLVFALGMGGLAWLGAWLAVSGRPARPVLAGLGRGVFSGRGLLVALVLVGGAWGYKAVRMAAAAGEVPGA